MRSSSSHLVLVGVAVLTLSVPAVQAQLLNELMRGAVNGVPTDMFGCDGDIPCDLSYRMYSLVEPSEVNGSANPVDGIPVYRAVPMRYLSDVQTTANFPVSSGAGAGQEWLMAWDGVTDRSSGDHVGWYGIQSQTVGFGEIGNSLSFNCLPVRAQEACFRALDVANAFNDTARDNGPPVSHLGGISPIPCPRLEKNGVTGISYVWDQATNASVTDTAPTPPIAGYNLYLIGNNDAPSQDDLDAGSVLLASVDAATLGVTVDRTTLGVPELALANVYGAALKLRYAGGLESLYHSCNAASTGEVIAEEPGDAPTLVDVHSVTLDRRVEPLMGGGSRELLYLTLQMTDQTIVRPQTKYRVSFDLDGDGGHELEIKAQINPTDFRRRSGVESIRLFTSGRAKKHLHGGIGIVLDDARGTLSFVFEPHVLASALAPGSPGPVLSHIYGRTQTQGVTDPFGPGGPVLIGTSSGL